MTKEVFIRIVGMQTPIGDVEAGDNEPIEALHTGTYYYKNGKHYLFYEEVAEGFPGVTKAQIRWQNEGILEVIKKGISNSHLIFEKNQRHACEYQTPLGNLDLGILTKRMSYKEEENRIEIAAEYNMDVDWEAIAECMIRINVSPRNSEIIL